LVTLFNNDISAQCAMCRATVESNVNEKHGQGQGLNTGILYLMTIPYILIGALGYLWYKSSRKETEKHNRIFDILKRKLI
jgi:hypothetical protein